MGSLNKFIGSQDGGGERGSVQWARADVDGLPFRGGVTNMKEDEYEEFAVRVYDMKNGVFDVLSNEDYQHPAHPHVKVLGNPAYLRMCDCCASGWFLLRHQDREFVIGDRKYIYVEWFQCYMEDGRPAKMPTMPTSVPQG